MGVRTVSRPLLPRPPMADSALSPYRGEGGIQAKNHLKTNPKSKKNPLYHPIIIMKMLLRKKGTGYKATLK
jgi:hypothetical protein